MFAAQALALLEYFKPSLDRYYDMSLFCLESIATCRLFLDVLLKERAKRVLIAFGTRPEALKFVPLIQAFKAASDFQCFVCLTGQHRQLLNQIIQFFNIEIDEDLRLMRPNQALEDLSGRVISKFAKIITKIQPKIVLVLGDTVTALMCGLASFYAGTPIAHLEAGLRTRDKFAPFPEEMNRTLLSRLADYHFTPTRAATQNLMREGVPRRDIFQVGNTIIDTLRIAAPLVKRSYPVFKAVDFNKRILFVTVHRRESFGQGMSEIFSALKKLAECFTNIEIVYPVHMNPSVFYPAHKHLSNVNGIHLMRPFTYGETYWILKNCYAVLTDSGGIQEEAPAFRKPVLVLRNTTERIEGIKAGIAKLVGIDANNIFVETEKLLKSPEMYNRVEAKSNLYGDGYSAERIVKILRERIFS